MLSLIPTFSLAAAGGLGYLAVSHHKQFNELAQVILFLAAIIGILAVVIGFTVDVTTMELKYKIASDEREEVLKVTDSWTSFWFKTALFCLCAFIYTIVLQAISESIQKETKTKSSEIDVTDTEKEAAKID